MPDSYLKVSRAEDTALQLAAARAGDHSAREAVARRALTLALRTATGAAGSRDAASDIAQDVAIEVLRQLGTLRDPGAFDAWVHRITVRKTMRALRRLRLRLAHEGGAEADLAERADPHAPAGSVDRLALELATRRALQSLPVKQRLAVVLRYVHDLSEGQVADALGCAPGTAASLLSRARHHLRSDPELRSFAAAQQGVAR